MINSGILLDPWRTLLSWKSPNTRNILQFHSKTVKYCVNLHRFFLFYKSLSCDCKHLSKWILCPSLVQMDEGRQYLSHGYRPLQCEQNHGYLQPFPLRRPVNVGVELQQPQQEAFMARGKPAVNLGNCRCHFSLLDRFQLKKTSQQKSTKLFCTVSKAKCLNSKTKACMCMCVTLYAQH